MPRESDAFSSSTAPLKWGPRSSRAKHKIEVVLPVPGGPAKIMLGRLPSCAITFKRFTVSSLPTTLSSVSGRNFSTQGMDKDSDGFPPFDFFWSISANVSSGRGIEIATRYPYMRV